MLNAIMIHYLSSKKNINKEEINYIFNLDYLPNNLIKDFFNHYEDLLALSGYGSYDRKSKIDLNMDDRLRNLYIWTLKEPKKNLGMDKIYELFRVCETDKQIESLVKKCKFTLKEIKDLINRSLENNHNHRLIIYLLENHSKNTLDNDDTKNIMYKALSNGKSDVVNTLLKNGYKEKINFEDIYDPQSLKHIIKYKKLNEDSIIFRFKNIILYRDLFDIIIDSKININKIKYDFYDFNYFKSNKEDIKKVYNKMLKKGFDFYQLDIKGKHFITEMLDKEYLSSFINYDLQKLNNILDKDLFEVIYYENNEIPRMEKESLMNLLEEKQLKLNPEKEYDISRIDYHFRKEFLNKVQETTNNYYLSNVGWNYKLIEQENIPLDKIKLLKGINLNRNTNIFINEDDEFNILSRMIENKIDLSYVSENNHTILSNNLLYGNSKSTKLLLENGYHKICDIETNTPYKNNTVSRDGLFKPLEKIDLEKYLLLKEYNLLEKDGSKLYNIKELQNLDLNYIEKLIEDEFIEKRDLDFIPSLNIDFLNPVVMKLILLSGKINKTDDTFGYNLMNFLAEFSINEVEDYKKAVQFYINNGVEVDFGTLSDDHEMQVNIIKECYSEKIAKEENIVLKKIFIEKPANIQSISKKRL